METEEVLSQINEYDKDSIVKSLRRILDDGHLNSLLKDLKSNTENTKSKQKYIRYNSRRCTPINFNKSHKSTKM